MVGVLVNEPAAYCAPSQTTARDDASTEAGTRDAGVRDASDAARQEASTEGGVRDAAGGNAGD
jgi:hypothetical protein